MIAVETTSGELVKVFNNFKETSFGFHQLFGFTTEKKAQQRLTSRKIHGHEFDQNNWIYRFNIQQREKTFDFKDMLNCEIVSLDKSSWKLTAPNGEFILRDHSQATITDSLEIHQDKANWLNGVTEKILFLIFLVIPLVLYFSSNTDVVEEEKKKDEIKPITVTLVQQHKTVNISTKSPSIEVKPLTESQIAKRAVQRNLGFLGLVGSKDLTKAVGGVPQKLKKATAGAGPGGDAGSGGEVLTGLGKGLKKTTVGNTGVAGLGGIGTKGAGGGAGGYGNTMVASGEGKGISAISMASNDMVLEGGLSRYAINATIAKYLSQVRRCYEKQLNKTPGIEGLVTVSFQINASGRLNFSKVKNSSLNNATVESCITQKMMGWKFPNPKGGVNVNINYPFMLRPVGT